MEGEAERPTHIRLDRCPVSGNKLIAWLTFRCWPEGRPVDEIVQGFIDTGFTGGLMLPARFSGLVDFVRSGWSRSFQFAGRDEPVELECFTGSFDIHHDLGASRIQSKEICFRPGSAASGPGGRDVSRAAIGEHAAIGMALLDRGTLLLEGEAGRFTLRLRIDEPPTH